LAFRQVHPQVCEKVSVSDTGAVTRAVETGSADLAFVVVQPAGTHLCAKEILCHELVLVAAPQHKFNTCVNVVAEQLRSESFILRDRGSGTRLCVEQALQEAGIDAKDLSIAFETNSNDAIRGAVKQGIGLAFFSRAAVADDLRQGRLVAVPVSDLIVRQSIFLVTNPQRLQPPAVRAFLTFLH